MKVKSAAMFVLVLVILSTPLMRRQYLRWEFDKAKASSLRNINSDGWDTDSPDPMTREFSIRSEKLFDRVKSVQFPLASDPELVHAISYADSSGRYLIVDWIGTHDVQGVHLVFNEAPSSDVVFGENDLMPRESAKGLYAWRSVDIPAQLPLASLEYMQLVGPQNRPIGSRLERIVLVSTGYETAQNNSRTTSGLSK